MKEWSNLLKSGEGVPILWPGRKSSVAKGLLEIGITMLVYISI